MEGRAMREEEDRERERERESKQASGDAIFLGFSHRFKIDRRRRWRLILH